MACAGIDFGNKKSVVAIARRGGIDICCNEVSNRATPSLVTFASEERHIGEQAANLAAQQHRNTVGAIQRLLGVDANSDFAKAEIARLTCNVVPHPQGAGSAVQVDYNVGADTDGPQIFPYQAVAGMLFSKLMEAASNEYKAPVSDCVVSVPGYYTESQRRAVVDACRIANINVLRVINENAALALSYGIFRTTQLPDTDPVKVAFVDMGESSTSVTIAAFTKSRCDILSSAFEPSLGGRNFDDLLVKKFATQWKSEHGIDAFSKPRAKLRIYKECEKLKRMLSANPLSFINIECFMNDIDVSGRMKRDELEDLAQPLLDRIKAVCEKALAAANLTDDEKLLSVEIVGGGMRVPCVKRVVSEALAPAPMKTTLNMDECIARGCALQSAMLSPAFKVRDYKVGDVSYFDLKAEKIFANVGEVESMKLIQKYDDTMPCVKAISFKPNGKLMLNVKYSDVSSLSQGDVSELVASYAIDAPEDTQGRVKAKIRLNENGIIELIDVSHYKEVEEMQEVEVKVEKSEKPANGETTDATMTDANGDAPATNGTAPTEEKPEDKDAKMVDEKPAEPEVRIEKRLVKKMKVTPVEYAMTAGPGSCMSDDAVKLAIEMEGKMRASDLYIKERGEALNALEAYVYDIRSRIEEYGDLAKYAPAGVRQKFKAELDDCENWIYSDEGEKANKSTFTTKRSNLVSKAYPILMRKKEDEERPVQINLLHGTIEYYKKLAVPGLEEYAHIAQDQKDKVIKCVEGAALWLKAEVAKQETVAKDVDPVLKCAAIQAKREEVDKVCGPIEKTPKPKPEETKVEEPAPAKETPSGETPAPDAGATNADEMEVDGEKK